MKIAIGGKGGSGKTTLAGTLARTLAQTSHGVLAIDGDSNPNLAATIGIPGGASLQIEPLPRDILIETVAENGERSRSLGMQPTEIVRKFAVDGPDGVRLILGGRVGHAGVGCMCGAHARVRSLLGELIGGELDGGDVVVDLEAGLENFSRGTPRHVDAIVAVVEPYFRSLETGRRVCELARELEVSRICAVANRIRNDRDLQAIQSFCDSHGIRLIGHLPYDDSLLDAEREGVAPIDYAPASSAVSEVRRLATALTSM